MGTRYCFETLSVWWVHQAQVTTTHWHVTVRQVPRLAKHSCLAACTVPARWLLPSQPCKAGGASRCLRTRPQDCRRRHRWQACAGSGSSIALVAPRPSRPGRRCRRVAAEARWAAGRDARAVRAMAVSDVVGGGARGLQGRPARPVRVRVCCCQWPKGPTRATDAADLSSAPTATEAAAPSDRPHDGR
jgi:hypothetical protein